jgi:DNA repair exonuclease SbcCD ATPase subunit
MANVTQLDPNRTGVSGPPRHTPSDDTPRNEPADANAARAGETRDMQRMAKENAQLLGNLRSRAEPADAADLNALRDENAELRAKLQELEQLIQGPDGIEAAWTERQREYEALLEEKSEVIRGLYLKIQELQSGPAAVSPAEAANAAATDLPATSPPPTDLAATDVSAKEVLDLQRQLEEERRQLKDDEEMLMGQMRDMEMAMARDRAELARHRAELQRLHSDLARELENANRDSGLRERLLALTRRPPPEPVKAKSPVPGTRAPGSKAPGEPAGPAGETKKSNSGFFRRMFGG